MRTTTSSAIAIVALLAVAACGGGDSTATTSPPTSATTTTVTVVPTTTAAPTTTVTTATTTTAAPTTTTTMAPSGMAEGEQLPGERLWALVPGNDVDAGRINLVFAGWNWDDPDLFREVARHTLSWDGRAYLTENGFPAAPPDQWTGGALGVFAIEPFRSHLDWFNVWYTDLEPDHPQGWHLPGDDPFDITETIVVTMAIDPETVDPYLTRSFAFAAEFFGTEPPVRPEAGFTFGHIVMKLDSDAPVRGMNEVAHELGHALFGLPDEYVGRQFGFDGRYDLSNWPSCAEDRAEAEAWWGDLVGEVDPMVDIWVDEMTRAGLWEAEDAAEFWGQKVAIGFVDGGCYGVPGSVRASEDSLMNGSIPVMGTVNRRWAEAILDLWDPTPRS